MRICETFESIQGEGALMGRPMLFVRLGGCNLSCEWCDTKYAHVTHSEMSIRDVKALIDESQQRYVCWTGGEPLLQKEDICSVIALTPDRLHCLETNGTIPVPESTFFHVAASPKSLEGPPVKADIYKFVITGALEPAVHKVLAYAHQHGIPREKIFLQPECATKADALERGAALWHLCVREGVALSPRLHTLLFGEKRGI